MANPVVTSVKLEVDETKTLSVSAINTQNRPADLTSPITWSVDDAAVATIVANDEQCAVTGVDIGTTQVHAESDGVTADIDVSVVAVSTTADLVDHLVITEVPANPPPAPSYRPG